MKKAKNIHPGEVLVEEFLKPMAISVYRLAQETGLSQTRLGQIARGGRGITAETALKLGKFFNVPAEFWMNLQALNDIEEAQVRYGKELKAIRPYEGMNDILALRKAKADPRNKRGRPFSEAVQTLGLETKADYSV